MTLTCFKRVSLALLLRSFALAFYNLGFSVAFFLGFEKISMDEHVSEDMSRTEIGGMMRIGGSRRYSRYIFEQRTEQG